MHKTAIVFELRNRSSSFDVGKTHIVDLQIIMNIHCFQCNFITNQFLSLNKRLAFIAMAEYSYQGFPINCRLRILPRKFTPNTYYYIGIIFLTTSEMSIRFLKLVLHFHSHYHPLSKCILLQVLKLTCQRGNYCTLMISVGNTGNCDRIAYQVAISSKSACLHLFIFMSRGH